MSQSLAGSVSKECINLLQDEEDYIIKCSCKRITQWQP